MGAINIDEYNRIEKKLIKYIYDTDIDLRRLLKYFLDTKGLSFIKFTELSKFIIYNELVKVHKACENAINETKGLATDKDIGPIILYDNLLFRYKLETSFGVRVRY